MLFLAIAPNDIQLAPGNWHPVSIPRIRNLAVKLSHAVQPEIGWLTQLATDAMTGRLPSAPGVTDHGSSKARPALVLVPGETDAEKATGSEPVGCHIPFK